MRGVSHRGFFVGALLIGVLLIGNALPVLSQDAAEGEDGHVEDEPESTAVPVTASKDKDLRAEEEVTETQIGPSPDAHVTFLITHPAESKELLVGKMTKFLIGFHNRGEKDFIVQHSETSFRYPQDFSYHIQNFTWGKYDREVSPKQEATFDYAFFPSEQFSGRPLGLVVNLHYIDADGTLFISTVFNDTITVVEEDPHFNTETGFLYLVFAVFAVLLLVAGQHFLSKMRRKHGMTKPHYVPPVEVGTANKNEVDFEWIPRELLNQNKSPKPGPGSPRQRKNRQD